MGQGTSDYGVDLNHRPPYSDRHLKYPQSSPLTNMYEQGTWPWLKRKPQRLKPII
jgi:hypothetical protein